MRQLKTYPPEEFEVYNFDFDFDCFTVWPK